MADHRRLANGAWEALLSAHATAMKEFGAEDTWTDLSMREYDVLYTLSKCPGPARMSELNRHVLLSQPAISRMVDRLAERGFIERRPDPADRRGVLLSLTGEGRAMQRRIGRRHARSVARVMTARLSRDELRQLETICLKLAGQPAPDHSAAPSQHVHRQHEHRQHKDHENEDHENEDMSLEHA